MCNGSNGTPDLRDRFLVGAGLSYSLGTIGGEVTHVLTVDEMPSHNHAGPTTDGVVHSEWPNGREVMSNTGNGATTGKFGYDYGDQYGEVPTGNRGNNYAHENRPPYYAVYYIMKL